MTDNRPGWHEWAMGIAEAVAQRTDCTRDKVGAVILDADHRIIATGYPGTAPGRRGCLEGACPRGLFSVEDMPHGTDYDKGPGFCISTHAEINAILQAGASKLDGSTLVVTRKPCTSCRKIITNSGIWSLVYKDSENERFVVKLV